MVTNRKRTRYCLRRSRCAVMSIEPRHDAASIIDVPILIFVKRATSAVYQREKYEEREIEGK